MRALSRSAVAEFLCQGKRLDGNAAINFRVQAEVHRGHRSAPDGLFNLVATDSLAAETVGFRHGRDYRRGRRRRFGGAGRRSLAHSGQLLQLFAGLAVIRIDSRQVAQYTLGFGQIPAPGVFQGDVVQALLDVVARLLVAKHGERQIQFVFTGRRSAGSDRGPGPGDRGLECWRPGSAGTQEPHGCQRQEGEKRPGG